MPKFISFNKTNVVKYGSGKKIIIGFHGWAGAYTDMEVFGKWLDKKKYTLYVLEFPGRGRTKSLSSHSIDDLVEFTRKSIDALNIKDFVFVSDCGFSQVSIRYAYLYPQKVKGIFLIFMPMLVPKVFRLRKYFYPVIYAFAKTRRLDVVLNKLRNSEKFMNKLFVDGNPPESRELAMIDISNKRKTDIRAAFESAYSILRTNVMEEWRGLKCKIEVIVAENDELMSYKKGMKYLKLNPSANITVVHDHKHHWDNEFIHEMREIFRKF